MSIRDTMFGRIVGEEAATVRNAVTEKTAVTDSVPVTADYVAGEILVQFTPGSASNGRHFALGQIDGNVIEDVGGHSAPGLVRVAIGDGMTVEKAIEILSHNPNVQFAEPNYVLHIDSVSNDPLYTGGSMWGMEGDQTNPANQFGSQAGEAWAAGYTGSTKVAIGDIDTGIDYTHPDLYLNVWLNQGEIPAALKAALTDTDGDGLFTFRDLNNAANAAYVTDVNANGRIDAGDLLNDIRWEDGTDQDGNSYTDDLIGWDFVNNDNDPFDDNDHGTHTAGTIAATGGNGTGVAGVTWSTQIIALKFLDASGSGSTADAVKALDYYTWAAGHAAPGAELIATNNSWGGGGYSQAMMDAIVRGAQADTLFIAAAGNGGPDQRGDNNDSVANYPSNYNTTSVLGWDSVIGVASITSTGGRSSFSNYGATTVELGAPGSGIYSTVPGGYASFSGTSMATPHVTGAIALFAAAGTETAREIRADLLASVAPTTSLSGITMTGGRLDIGHLMQMLGGSPPPPPPTVNNIYGTTTSNNIVGTTGDDKIWGIPASGSNLGKGTIDTLTGNGGNDIFVLGDSRGRFYDDGKSQNAGTSDYALIKDFNAGDKIQLAGVQTDYLQHSVTLNGVSGSGIYYDSNHNHSWDSRDELIGLVQNVASVATSDFIFGGP